MKVHSIFKEPSSLTLIQLLENTRTVFRAKAERCSFSDAVIDNARTVQYLRDTTAKNVLPAITDRKELKRRLQKISTKRSIGSIRDYGKTLEVLDQIQEQLDALISKGDFTSTDFTPTEKEDSTLEKIPSDKLNQFLSSEDIRFLQLY